MTKCSVEGCNQLIFSTINKSVNKTVRSKDFLNCFYQSTNTPKDTLCYLHRKIEDGLVDNLINYQIRKN